MLDERYPSVKVNEDFDPIKHRSEHKAFSLEAHTRTAHDHNHFLSQLSEETLSNLEKLNTQHYELTQHDKATTARLAFDTLIEDRYLREHNESSANAPEIRKRFRTWINSQLDGSFHMPLVAYFSDARIVLGVQLGEHTREHLQNCFQALGL